MTDTEKKLLNESLSKLYKIDPEKLDSLYNESGELTDFSTIFEADKERVKNFKSEKDDQFKRGIKEGAGKIEKEVKEKYDVDSDLTGVDLINDVIVKQVEEASNSESIKEHPEFLKARDEWERDQKKRDKEWQDRMKNLEGEFSKKELLNEIDSYGLSLLDKEKPILPESPDKQKKWLDVYRGEVRKGNYKKVDNKIIVLNDDGEALKNEHGYTVTLDEHIHGIMEQFFEFEKGTPRSGPGVKPGTGEPPDPELGFTPPKTEDERLQLLRDPEITPELRKKITEYEIKT